MRRSKEPLLEGKHCEFYQFTKLVSEHTLASSSELEEGAVIKEIMKCALLAPFFG